MSQTNISYKKQLLETPFHEKTREKCYAHDWHRWAGYKVVKQYTSAELEYTALRNTAGVIDITPMHKYNVQGKDAKRFINKLVTRQIENIQPNQVVYALWCNEDGFVVDDGTIFCIDDNNFRICCGERNLNWFEDTAIGYDVTIEDISHSIAALAFQGPLSCKILHMLKANNIENLKPFFFDQFTISNHEIAISRTGFSGDLGYELWCDPSQAHDIWDALFSFNKDYKILAAGLDALEMVRVEAGFIVVNADLIAAEHALRPNRMRTPYELGLAWMVNLDKEFFTGKEALIKQKNKGVEKKLIGLDVQGDKPAVGSVLYNDSKKEIGIVTAAMWSPILKSNIAMGYVDKEFMKLGSKVLAEIYHPEELEYRKIWAQCKVVKKQFITLERRNAVPALI
jgi:aminomethyltransferase